MFLKSLLFAFSFLLFANANDYKLEKSSEGVKVWIKDDSRFYRFKAQMEVEANPNDFISLFEDFASHTKWSTKLKEINVLSSSKNQWEVLMVLETPWPLKNRYQILNCKKITSKGVTTYKLTNSENTKKVKGAIRITDSNGFWKVETLGKNKIRITQEVYADPKINLPKSWGKSKLINEVHKSFVNIKSII